MLSSLNRRQRLSADGDLHCQASSCSSQDQHPAAATDGPEPGQNVARNDRQRAATSRHEEMASRSLLLVHGPAQFMMTTNVINTVEQVFGQRWLYSFMKIISANTNFHFSRYPILFPSFHGSNRSATTEESHSQTTSPGFTHVLPKSRFKL